MYIGNGAYCYANSASMFIKGTGHEVSPSLLEVLSGVGLGVTMYRNGSLFLHNNTADPDAAISQAMKILGFSFVEEFSHSAELMPIDDLKEVLKKSTAILGPVDMGYLTYSPNHQYAKVRIIMYWLMILMIISSMSTTLQVSLMSDYL